MKWNWPFGKGKEDASIWVGMEIGSEGVAIAALDVNQDPPKLLACEYIAANELEHIRLVKKWLVDQHIQNATAVRVLHPSDYELLLLEAPKVEDDEMRDAIQWRMKDLINDPLEMVTFDIFKLPGDAYRGRLNMVYGVVAKKGLVETTLKFCERTGLNLHAVDITELAIMNLLYGLNNIDDLGVGVLRLRGHSSLINLAQERNLYMTRNIETGLEELEGVSDSQLDSLSLEIQRSLDYYESQIGKGNVAKIFLLPLTNFKGVDEFTRRLEERLPTKVKMLEIHSYLECDEDINPDHVALCSTAIGAALRALREKEVDHAATD